MQRAGPEGNRAGGTQVSAALTAAGMFSETEQRARMGLEVQPTFVEMGKRRGSWHTWAWNRGVAGPVRATGTAGSAAPGMRH